MLDIQFIRDNAELVIEKSKQKGYDTPVNELLKVDASRRELQTTVEALRQKRNELAAGAKGQSPTAENVELGKSYKQDLIKSEKELKALDDQYLTLLQSVPNMPLEAVPVGASEAENKVTKKIGEPIDYDFAPKNHWEIEAADNLIDKTRAVKVAGSRFVYLKGALVQLQFAIIQWTLEKLSDEHFLEKIIEENQLDIVAKPFVPVLPPALINTKAYEATTRLNAEETTYKLADDELWLNASAEHSLCNMYMDEIIPEIQLPIRYIGYATSFRREAGTYGKDTEGTIRMHQFDKLEMEVFSTPETGLNEHKLLIAIEEHLVGALGLPYQYLQKCTADIGKPNASGIDIEVWFPGQGKYRETHTADYMTDYQARSLKTRLRRANNNTEFVHTNDATAFAFPRILAAIIENYQTKDGHIIIPEVLKPYMAGKTEI
jgi:seryl-tRNA synthetase